MGVINPVAHLLAGGVLMPHWPSIALVLLLPVQTFAQDRFEVPLNLDLTHQLNQAGPKISLGSVRIVSHAGDSRRHQYFNIPSERSAQKAPGFVVRIPLGD